MSARFIAVDGKRINVAHIVKAEIDSSYYMNGSAHWLVVVLSNGERIRKEHGWGFDAFATLGQIDAATAMPEVSP